MAKRIVTETDIYKASERGEAISAPPEKCLVTPQARDRAYELGVRLVEDEAGTDESAGETESKAPPRELSTEEEKVVGEVITMMQSKLPVNMDADVLESLVREVVEARHGTLTPDQGGSNSNEISVNTEADGVHLIKNQRLMSDESGFKPVPGKVIMSEAITNGEKKAQFNLSAGFMEWEKASFSRTVECEEICIVVDGRLQLTVGGKSLIAKSGDMVYLPKGVNALYSAPEHVKLACVNCIE